MKSDGFSFCDDRYYVRLHIVPVVQRCVCVRLKSHSSAAFLDSVIITVKFTSWVSVKCIFQNLDVILFKNKKSTALHNNTAPVVLILRRASINEGNSIVSDPSFSSAYLNHWKEYISVSLTALLLPVLLLCLLWIHACLYLAGYVRRTIKD